MDSYQTIIRSEFNAFVNNLFTFVLPFVLAICDWGGFGSDVGRQSIKKFLN